MMEHGLNDLRPEVTASQLADRLKRTEEKMKKIRFYNIRWDTTDDQHPDGQDASLPDEATIEVADDTDPEEDGANALSDEYGWCVFGFDYESEPAG